MPVRLPPPQVGSTATQGEARVGAATEASDVDGPIAADGGAAQPGDRFEPVTVSTSTPAAEADGPGALVQALATAPLESPARAGGALHKRFGFVGSCPDPAGKSFTERMMTEGVLTVAAVDAHVCERSGADNLSLRAVKTKTIQNEIGAKAGGVVLDTIRDVTSSVVTGAVYDAIALMKSIDTASWSELPRWGSDPPYATPGTALTAEPKDAGERLNNYRNQSRPGAYGEALARAMIDVNRVLFPLIAREIAPELHGEVVDLVFKDARFTFQSEPRQALWEGLVTIMQAIEILVAKEVQSSAPMDLDQILTAIADSGVVSHMASLAPFGVIGPMSRDIHREASSPASQTRISDRGRVIEPDVLLDKIKATAHARAGVPANPSETLRGCPIATRGVVIGDDGRPQLTEDAPLTEITRAYIDLVKVALRAADHRPSGDP